MGGYRRFTWEEKLFISETVVGRHYAEVAKMFNERFSPPATTKQIRAKCQYHKTPGAKRGIPFGHRRSVNTITSRHKATGSEKVSLDGYTKVKTENGRWVGKHVLIWEGQNGKIPDGHRVIFADSDKNNFALDNLLLVSNAEAAVMNILRLRSTDPDITRLGHAVAKMRIAANRAIKEKYRAQPVSTSLKTREPNKNKKRGASGEDTHVQA